MGKKSEASHWVGLDLGGTKMLATVFTEHFAKLASAKKKTKGSEGSQEGLKRLISLIDEVLAACGVGRDHVAGIGIASPGPLDLDKGIILEAPNLGWKKVDVRRHIEAEFGCPVVVLNDVDAGVYGEYRFGAGKGARCLVGVFPGTGIGGGCVYEGRLLRGRRNSCMEIGHFPVVDGGAPCGCGRSGCLETVSSRLAIAAEAAKAALRGEAPYLMANGGTDLANLRSSTLAASVAAGDVVVDKIVRRAARTLGRAVGGLINLLAPDVVVLGGGLVEAMPDLYLEEVAKGVARTVMPSYADEYLLKVAKLGGDAAVRGAAAWAAASAKS